MRKFYKLLKYLAFFFALIAFISFPRPVLAAPLNDVFSSTETMIDNSVAKEGENKATEFAEEIKNVLAPGSAVRKFHLT